MSGTPSPLDQAASQPSPQDEEHQQQQQQAAVVGEHLPPGYTAEFDGAADSPGPSTSSPQQEDPESSLKLQGGDIHRSLFKINARAPAIKRAQTFSHTSANDGSEDDAMTVAAINEPQGFRRQFIHHQRKSGFAGGVSIPITRNFVEFLELYGSFAGEDLEDSDEEAIEDDDGQGREEEEEGQAGDEESRLPPAETRPLLGRRKSTRTVKKGDAGTAKTFFTLLKAFIGTGIMFLPKAFNNGGILFSALTLLFVACISMWAFHLLLKCREKVGGSYGDIGMSIAGPRMRAVILTSITLSQLGFVCTGLVFVADNWSSFLSAVTDGASPLTTKTLIAVQAVLLTPLSFIRNISKLGFAAQVADAFILIGLVYIWYYDIAALAARGMHPTVQLFNPRAYTLTVGASIFTFEGIGLIIPIHASMRSPHRFEPLLAAVMLLITCIFCSVGALSYATFGAGTRIEVIDNYPQSSRLVNAVQFMYALAVLIGNPVQLFPAMRILEARIFPPHRSGKRDSAVKWRKNAFRTLLVALCVAVAAGGSTNLDRFVALIGSVACVPLVYIYPPFLHYRAVAASPGERVADAVLVALGAVGMVYTTAITILNSFL